MAVDAFSRLKASTPYLRNLSEEITEAELRHRSRSDCGSFHLPDKTVGADAGPYLHIRQGEPLQKNTPTWSTIPAHGQCAT